MGHRRLSEEPDSHRVVGGHGARRQDDQRAGREDRFIDYYENAGEGLAHYVQALREGNCTQCRQDEDGNCEMRDLVEYLSQL